MADPTPDPQWAALRRAVHAALDAHDRTRAPFLVYLESAYGARVIAESSRERALYTASSHEHEPGDIYAAVFDVRDSAWPDPVWSQYLPAPADRVAVAGVGLWPEIIGAPTPTGPVTSPEQVDTTQNVVDPQPGSPVPTPGAPELSQRDLYAAADQLFWNATGYKPNTPLNPKDPRDRAMLPQWWQAYAQARALAYASGFPVPGAPPGQRPQVDWSQQSFGPGTPGAPEITVGPVTVTPSNPVSSGVVGMNSGDPWLPLLRNAPLSVGANAAEYGLRSSVRARSALVGALAPVLAPGTGAITGRIDLDANQVLHAKIASMAGATRARSTCRARSTWCCSGSRRGIRRSTRAGLTARARRARRRSSGTGRRWRRWAWRRWLSRRLRRRAQLRRHRAPLLPVELAAMGRRVLVLRRAVVVPARPGDCRGGGGRAARRRPERRAGPGAAAG